MNETDEQGEPRGAAAKQTALDIFRALNARHPQPDWIFLGEVRTRTGYNVDLYGTLDSARSIDAFAMHTWHSKDFRRVAYEIKISRGDWLREINDPKKRTQAYFLSHQFYFALAPGIFQWSDVKKGDLDGCGVLEVAADGTITELRKAKVREAWPMPDSFIASLLRQAMGVYEKPREAALRELGTEFAPVSSLFGAGSEASA